MPLLGTFAGSSARAFGFLSAPKPVVTGGTLASDSTYFYRTFTSNGSLVITEGTLNADILVVAGGGSGGYGQYINSPIQNYLVGSGGGAGGLKLFSPSLSPNTYTVTVGAGGSGAIGNSSSLSSYLTNGGGFFTTNGGSGQGSGAWLNNGIFQDPAAGAGYSGEGNAGSPTGFNGVYNGGTAGGGGGKGAVGSGINGGAGTNTYSSWASATGTGVSGYYAGGGGGAGGSGANGGGNGIAGASSGSTAGSGTANSGGGGGGISTASGTVYGGNGGSGIVIVRYLKTAV